MSISALEDKSYLTKGLERFSQSHGWCV